MVGFAYFNRPVATLFLGDVGSLPIGLLLGWLLVQLAGRGALAAAILLPLYYLADATITLVRRLIAGEKVWQAHRSHFYQRATDRGFTVKPGGGHVFAVNIALAALAFFTLVRARPSQRRGCARLRRGSWSAGCCWRSRAVAGRQACTQGVEPTPKTAARASRRNRARSDRS